MPRTFSVASLCVALFALAMTTMAAEPAPALPVVRVVVFVAPHCSPCQDLYAYLLPSMNARYGNRLEWAEVDVTQPEGAAVYRAAATSYGLGVWQETPVVLVGQQALVGLDAIATTLGDGFATITGKGAAVTHWPEVPGLAALLPEGVRTLKSKVAALTPAPLPPAGWHERFLQDRAGNTLAITVLAGMLLVFAHILVRLRRGVRQPRFMRVLLPLVLLVGAGISAYTAYVALVGIAPLCGPVGDCAKVQSSVYSHLFGIPLGIFGVMGYLAILITWLLAGRLSPNGAGWYWVPWAIALAGFVFSLGLVTLEPFFIGATCLWCLSSATSMTLALWLVTGTVAQRKSAG